MYTRSRQSQNFPPRGPNNPMQSQGSFQGPNAYNQQGGYQQQQQQSAAGQQGSFKSGYTANAQVFKPQQQPPPQQQQQQPPPAQQQQQQPPPQIQQQQLQQQQSMTQLQQQAAVQRSMQAQQQQQIQQQQQQPPPPQQQQQQQQPPPQPQRLKPILKQPTTPQASTPAVQSTAMTPQQPNPNPAPANNANDVKMDETESLESEPIEQPKWRRKLPGFKVNKKLKRLRMNQRLRKTLQPKNAIMVLNEMKAGVQFTFPETQGTMPNSLYVVHAELDGKTYVGQGLSKPLARQNAAENALKALLLEKMTAASIKARIDAETDGPANKNADGAMEAKEETGQEPMQTMETSGEEADEIPWSSLASFALYKLFLEWHNQGTSVPVPRPGLPSPAKGAKRELAHANKNPVQKELPPNATNIHPVMLLNQMRPGLTYLELNRVGNPPNTMFTLAVDVDGVQYVGTAKNKKDAKKIVAKAALQALYNLTYPDDMKMETDVQVN